MRPFRSPADLAEVALLVLAALLYFATLDNGLQPYELLGGDLITHHYAQAEARFANAPGYPLYSIGGWLWFRTLHTVATALGNPFPNPVPLLSSYSTLWALPALWLLYRLLLRYTRTPHRPQGDWPIAWLLCAFFGTTYFFWYYATTSEQYSSAVAQTLAILYVYHRWADRLQSHATLRPTPSGANGWLYLLAFLCGISLAHMLTVAFIVPPLVAVVLWQAPGLLRSPAAISRAVGAAALPLLSYLFVYIRGGQNPQWRGQGEWESTADWFWSFVATGQGQEELGWGFAPDAPLLGNGFPELMWGELSLPLLILGIVGIGLLSPKPRAILVPTLAIYLIFCWAYRMGNWFQVILPAYPLLILGAGALLTRVTTQWAKYAPGSPRAHLPRAVILLGLAALLAWRIDASLPAADSRDRAEDTALNRAAQLLDLRLPAGAHVFASVEDTLALQYLTRVWNIRPDLVLAGRDSAQMQLAQHGEVFITAEAISLFLAELAPPATAASPARYEVDAPLAGWYRIGQDLPANAATTSSATRLGQQFSRVDVENIWERKGLVLVGYAWTHPPLATATVHPQADDFAPLDVLLLWNGRDSGTLQRLDWPADLNISVRLLDESGQILPLGGFPAVHADNTPEPPRAIIDRPRPAPLLPQMQLPGEVTEGALELIPAPAQIHEQRVWLDPYRFNLRAEHAPVHTIVHTIEVILYRTAEDGFENLAILHLPLDASSDTPPEYD